MSALPPKVELQNSVRTIIECEFNERTQPCATSVYPRKQTFALRGRYPLSHKRVLPGDG
jgi:hypothetical protein